MTTRNMTVRVGDHVKRTVQGSFYGMTGVVTSLATPERRMEVTWDDNRPIERGGLGPYVSDHEVELFPVTVQGDFYGMTADPRTHVNHSAMYNQVEAERNALKAERDALKAELAKANRGNGIDRKQVEDLMVQLAAEEQRVRLCERSYAAENRMLADALKKAERRAYKFEKEYNEKIPEYAKMLDEGLRKAEQRAKSAIAEKEELLKAYLAYQEKHPGGETNRFCVSCGTPYRVEEEEPKMEPHVPRWARNMKWGTRCLGCRHLKRYGYRLTRYPCPCSRKYACKAETYDKYEPRYTRQQRRAASLKGQLKQARADNVGLKEMLTDAERNGLEAVAKAAEVADKKIKVLEAKQAASVPLENAIPATINTDKIATRDTSSNGRDFHTWKVQVLTVRLPEDMIVNPADVVLIKKASLPKQKEAEKP